MFAFHPNAYLNEKRNVRQGLASRTKILRVLEKKNATANAVVKEAKLSYSVVLHHLRLLESEMIVLGEKDKRPYLWNLTGIGQQRLETV